VSRAVTGANDTPANETRPPPSGRFGSATHLAKRFLGALWPGGPRAEDERWALAQLLPGERELWRRMRGPDRRHAVAVARASARLLDDAGETPRREVLAGALLHDVGKVATPLNPIGRAAATAAAVVLGPERLAGGAGATGWRAAARSYLEHDRVGGELLREAGSDPFTIAWAEQHHEPPERWTIDPRIGRVLSAADRG
jgi:putative nucleotidyltransferase with HDIG domain